MAADVVLRLVAGSSRSAAFSGVSSSCPTSITVLAARQADIEQAERLYGSLLHELSVAGQPADVPALGGERDTGFLNLLVFVASDAAGALIEPDLLTLWLDQAASSEDSPFHVLPVAPLDSPDRRQMSAVRAIDARLGELNVAWWHLEVTELVPQIFLASGVITGEFRLFISYRRDDCQAAADQLFGALVKEGFSVFLDRFSVPQGVLFQRYLTEQLEDKSMVMVLETPNFATSPWTQFEVAFAKKRRLGVCAATYPQVDVKGARDVFEADRRFQLQATDFEYDDPKPSKSAHLTEDALSRLVQFVKRQHNLAYVRRRQMMFKDLALALLLNQMKPLQWDKRGAFVLDNGGKKYKFAIVPRPAELGTFYDGVHREPMPPGTVSVVVSPYLKAGSTRRQHIDWIGGLSKTWHFDSSRIFLLALLIKAGKL